MRLKKGCLYTKLVCALIIFRDRSIPELDEILDAKLSEVQDHMRTLMQKQVSLGVFQAPCIFSLRFCCCGWLFYCLVNREATSTTVRDNR